MQEETGKKETSLKTNTETLVHGIGRRRLALYSISVGDQPPLSRSEAASKPSDRFLVQVALGPVDNVAFFGLCNFIS